MGERADGDVVDAGFGVGAHVAQVDEAADLQAGAPCCSIHGGLDLGPRHVVQQDELGSGGEGFVELTQGVDFDLNANAVPVGRMCNAQGDSHTAGRGDVVVLDENGVEEAEAVVDAAAQGDGVFVQRAKTRDGLAGVEDGGAGSGDRVDECAGERGDAAEALEEVEGRCVRR